MTVDLTETAAAAAAPLGVNVGPGRYRCRDGLLSVHDVARAAGVKPKDARRAVDRAMERTDDPLADGKGVTLSFDSDLIPDPRTTTRAEMGRYVAQRLGLGRFGIQQRMADRAATRTDEPQQEKPVKAQSHPYKREEHGRSVRSAQDGGGVIATLTCSKAGCDATEDVRFRQLCGSSDMDRKFIMKGWAVDPAQCPAHNRRNHRKDPAAMATTAKTSPAAIQAQAKMFGLLQTHFDAEKGCYGSGYSDQRIADDCGLSVDLVAGVRREAFGEISEPPEVTRLGEDIATVEALLTEAETQLRGMRDMVDGLKTRLGDLKKKFAA